MRKVAIAMISSLLISGCAAFQSNPPPTIHPTRVTPGPIAKSKDTASVNLNNPFKSKADEELFWKIMNGEIDNPEVKKVEDTPFYTIAIGLRILLSCQSTDDKLRTEIITGLLGNVPQLFMSEETIAKVTANLSGENMMERLQALHFIFALQAKGANIINYVLNDKEHMLPFFKNEMAACEETKKATPNGKTFKPAPPATNSSPGKVKSPKPKSNKHSEPTPPAPAPVPEPRSCPTQSF